MKRALFETVKVLPYTSGTSIDLRGYLSARLGLVATGAGALKIIVKDCDTAGGTFTQVHDTRLFLEATRITRDSEQKITDVFTTATVAVGDELQLDIDLVGCKQFVQVIVSGAGAATAALALGDRDTSPVA